MSTAQEASERHQFIRRMSMFDVAGCEEFCRQCGQFADAEIHANEPQPATVEGERLTCRGCRKSFTPDQLSLTEDNGDTAFCSASGLFHDFGESDAQPTTPHTATPWREQDATNETYPVSVYAEGRIVAYVLEHINEPGLARVNAALIVQAVNAHAALVKAVEIALTTPGMIRGRDELVKALALAGK